MILIRTGPMKGSNFEPLGAYAWLVMVAITSTILSWKPSVPVVVE